VLDGLVLDQTSAADNIKSVDESTAFRRVAYQPPLYAWLEAIAFSLSAQSDPLGSVLPSYVAGALVVVLVYLHGRLWRGAGFGLTAAILMGFNQSLLLRMQEATPATLVLCGILASLLAYGLHERAAAELKRPWHSANPLVWAVTGGLTLGLALLALGGLALVTVPIVLLHQCYQHSAPLSSSWRVRDRFRSRRWKSTGLFNGMVAIAVAAAISSPWFVLMLEAHGWKMAMALSNPPDGLLVDHHLGLLPRLINLAPATLALGLYGAVRAIRSALVDDSNTDKTIGGPFWVVWLVVAGLVSAVWPTGPQSVLDLILLVPLSLLAAQTITDFVTRSIPVHALIWLAPTTLMSIAWSVSADLSSAADDVAHGHINTATVLVLHVAFDAIIVSIIAIRALNRWARRHDDRQRRILAAYLATVLIITIVVGMREVLFRHSETHDLLTLRTMILRRNREVPFNMVAVVGSPRQTPPRSHVTQSADRPLPGGRLRFILRTALRKLPQHDLSAIDDLFELPAGQRLIVLTGTEQRLRSADQLKLGLEAIHPGRLGILDAYATTRNQSIQR
jgi:4-amino-4-deoxy-L-arabinose transferase-like glycosyltransferase